MADRLGAQPCGADRVGLGKRPLDTFGEAGVGKLQCECQDECQEAEHSADHHTHTLRLNLSSPRFATIPEPVTGFVRQHLGSQEQQGESKHTPVGDRRKQGHFALFLRDRRL